jgi:hypothetical protein
MTPKIPADQDLSDRHAEPKAPTSSAKPSLRRYQTPRVEKREPLADVTGFISSGVG